MATTTSKRTKIKHIHKHTQDGFIHLTARPELLLSVANTFYVSSAGDWLCLELDAAALTAKARRLLFACLLVFLARVAPCLVWTRWLSCLSCVGDASRTLVILIMTAARQQHPHMLDRAF